MRASSLSNAKVITLLNRYFVPVYVSTEEDGHGGTAPAEEQAEYQRIFREAGKAGLTISTVCVYLLTPDGQPFDSLHVAQACQPERLIPMLEKAVKKLQTPPGNPLVKPKPQSQPPAHAADALVLHLTARVLRAGGAWDQFPAENWVVLPREQWSKFLPPGRLATGKSWEIDPEAAAMLLRHFYPATENNDIGKNQIDKQVLRGRLLGTHDGLTRVRLSGQLRMKHTFYQKEDANVVEGSLAGYLDFDPVKNRIRTLQIVTDEATYGHGTFGVAVRSVP